MRTSAYSRNQILEMPKRAKGTREMMHAINVYVKATLSDKARLVVSFPSNLQGARVAPVYAAKLDAAGWAIDNLYLTENWDHNFMGGQACHNVLGQVFYARKERVI
jgi:hypothetical protein